MEVLKTNKTLTELNLEENNIGEEGFKAISDIIDLNVKESLRCVCVCVADSLLCFLEHYYALMF